MLLLLLLLGEEIRHRGAALHLLRGREEGRGRGGGGGRVNRWSDRRCKK